VIQLHFSPITIENQFYSIQNDLITFYYIYTSLISTYKLISFQTPKISTYGSNSYLRIAEIKVLVSFNPAYGTFLAIPLEIPPGNLQFDTQNRSHGSENELCV